MTALAQPVRGAAPAHEVGALLVGWRLELVLVALGVVSVVVNTRGNGQPLLYVIGGAALVMLAMGVGRPAAERRVIAVSTLLGLLIAIPINRVSGATIDIVAVMVACLAVTGSALVRTDRPLPRGWVLVVAMTAVAGFVTVLAPDEAGLLRFAPYVVSFAPAYLLFGQMRPWEQRRILRVLLVLAVLEGAFASAEPFVGAGKLWSATQINSLGVGVDLANPLIPSLARSQGTLGHPLPLGILLAVAVAVLLRATSLGTRTRVLVAIPLCSGLLFSGSRNSILIAVLVLAYFSWRSGTAVRWVSTTLALVFAVVALVVAGVLNAAVTNDFEVSGSVTHRSGAIAAAARLVTDQDLLHVLLGNGWASTARLFDAGLLQTDGFGAVDNEIVLLVAQGGLVTLGLLVALVVLAVVGARPAYRPALAALVLTLFVFDLLIWPSAAVLFGIVLAAGVQRLDLRRGLDEPSTRPAIES